MKIIVLNSRTDYARTPISEDCYFNNMNALNELIINKSVKPSPFRMRN